MKKILITGAAGFIGSHLVEHLIADGVSPKQLRLLIPKGESLKNLPDLSFEILRGDIRNISDVKKALRGVSIVYHLAALIVKPEYTKKDYYSVNTKGVENLVKHSNNVSKFIFFSTVAIYGLPAYSGDMVSINESSEVKPAEIYGESKLDAEKILVNSKVPYIIIRPTTVYGPRDDHGLLELFQMIGKKLFVQIGNGNNKLDYVFVKDLVRAARLAEKSRKLNEAYIIGGGGISLKNVSKSIANSLKVSLYPIRIPKIVAYVLSVVLKFASDILHIHVPLYPARVRAMTSNFTFDFSKARSELKYRPMISFSKGCEITAEWVYDNRYL